MVEPFISVTITSYNSEIYLPKCLAGLEQQTFRDFEVILVDDGSTDNTQGYIDEYINKGTSLDLKYIRTENCGQSHARNVGLDNAKGQYIFCHDSDDYIEPNALELLAKKARETKADRIYSEFYIRDENGTILEHQHLPKNPSKWTYGSCCATLFKRSVFVDNGLRWLESAISEDAYINFRYNCYCRECAWVYEPTYNWVQHPKSISAPKTEDNVLIANRMMREILDFSIPIYESLQDEDDRLLMMYELTKLYYLSIYRANRLLPLRLKISSYGQTHDMMLSAFPGYLKNKYLYANNSPLRTPTRQIVCLSAILEKIHLERLFLVAFHLLSKFYKFAV